MERRDKEALTPGGNGNLVEKRRYSNFGILVTIITAKLGRDKHHA
jgi:hypothetical protein